MIASIVWDVDPILFKVGSWEVRWYGLMWGLGGQAFRLLHSQYGHWRPSGALFIL